MALSSKKLSKIIVPFLQLVSERAVSEEVVSLVYHHYTSEEELDYIYLLDEYKDVDTLCQELPILRCWSQVPFKEDLRIVYA